MDRRDFLRTTGGLAALATGCTSAAAVAATANNNPGDRAGLRRMTFASPWQAHHAGLADDAHRLAHRLEAAADGSVGFEVRPGTSARADVTVTPVQSEIALHPAFAVFGGLPGFEVLRPREVDTWLAYGGGQDLWDDLAAPHGFKPLLAGHTGANVVLWSRTPILTPIDLAGRRVVARGLDADVVRALGAAPVIANETELEAALNDPGIDAVVWGSLVHASAAGIPARFPHGLSAALGCGGGTIAVEIDLTVWDSLTHAQQTVFAAVAKSEFLAAVADAEATSDAVAAAIAVRHGAVIKSPTPEFAAAVSRIAAAVVAHTAAHDDASARIDRSYSAFRRAVNSADVKIA